MTANQHKTIDQSINAPLQTQVNNSNKTIEPQIKGISTEECNKIRQNRMYKGQLAYLKDILLKEDPSISEAVLSERLDISQQVAKLLLYDSKNDYSDT